MPAPLPKPIRKTSLALAAIVGAVTFFIAPHPAGLAKGVSRSARMGSITKLSMCKPDATVKTALVYELIYRFRKLAATPADMKAAAHVMGVTVPLCVQVGTGLLSNKGKDSWTSGAVFWYFLGLKDKVPLMDMLHVGYMPDADFTTNEEDCPKTWLQTHCNRRDLMAQCLILEVDNIGHMNDAKQGCVLADDNLKGSCSMEWVASAEGKIRVFTQEECGSSEGGDSTTKALDAVTNDLEAMIGEYAPETNDLEAMNDLEALDAVSKT